MLSVEKMADGYMNCDCGKVQGVMCSWHAAEFAYLESLPTEMELAAIKAAAKAEEKKKAEELFKKYGCFTFLFW